MIHRRGIVVKVGGSLFDHPRLFPCLNSWLKTLPRPVLIVPGGGTAADAVRAWHHIHGLSESDAHEVALASLKTSSELFLKMIPESVPTDGRSGLSHPLAIVDVHAFGQTSALPKSWAVTTDSLAAEVAGFHQSQLILLKSVTIPKTITWCQAAAYGYVDEHFPLVCHDYGLNVTVINFRSWIAEHESTS